MSLCWGVLAADPSSTRTANTLRGMDGKPGTERLRNGEQRGCDAEQRL